MDQKNYASIATVTNSMDQKSLEEALPEQLRRDAQIIPESILERSDPRHDNISRTWDGSPAPPPPTSPLFQMRVQPTADPEHPVPAAPAASASAPNEAKPATFTRTNELSVTMPEVRASSSRPSSLSPRTAARQVWASELPPSPRNSPRRSLSPRGDS